MIKKLSFIFFLEIFYILFLPAPVFSSPKFFSSTSAWNIPIPPNAVFSTNKIGTIKYCGLDSWDDNSWTIPFYTSTTGDGLHPLLYNELAWQNVSNGQWLRSGNSASVESQILASSKPLFPYTGNVYSSMSTTSWKLPQDYNKTLNPPSPPAKFYFNTQMSPATAPDGHIAILQPNGLVLEAYSAIILSTGQLVALSYAVTDPKSRGDGWQNGQTASMLPDYAGHIYEDEITTGINHAIAIAIPASLLKASIAYPAFAFDRNALTANPPYSGNVPMGGRIALPPSLNVSSLNLQTKEGKSIANAAKTYGFIVTDRNGEGITLKVQPVGLSNISLMRNWNSKLQTDLLSIFNNLRLVNFSLPETPH